MSRIRDCRSTPHTLNFEGRVTPNQDKYKNIHCLETVIIQRESFDHMHTRGGDWNRPFSELSNYYNNWLIYLLQNRMSKQYQQLQTTLKTNLIYTQTLLACAQIGMKHIKWISPHGTSGRLLIHCNVEGRQGCSHKFLFAGTLLLPFP